VSIFAGTALWALIGQSDGVTWGVLIALLCMSIACWTVALYKLTMLRKYRRDINAIKHRLEQITIQQELPATVVASEKTIVSSLCTRLTVLVREQLSVEQISYQIVLLCDEILVEQESGNAVLKATVEAAPLLGLLGTIWGLIHSFMRISQEKMADIITVAPGIAEALITTLMGLLVAIPALILFHLVHRQLQLLEHEIGLLAQSAEQVVVRVRNHLQEV